MSASSNEMNYCSLTGEKMTDPVVAADGCRYERAAIVRHIEENCKAGPVLSPVTKKILENYSLTPLLKQTELLDSDNSGVDDVVIEMTTKVNVNEKTLLLDDKKNNVSNSGNSNGFFCGSRGSEDKHKCRNGWIITGTTTAVSTTLGVVAYVAQLDSDLALGLKVAAAITGGVGLVYGGIRCGLGW